MTHTIAVNLRTGTLTSAPNRFICRSRGLSIARDDDQGYHAKNKTGILVSRHVISL